MPTPKLKDDELQKTLDAHAAAGGSVQKAAARLGIEQSAVGRRMRRAKERGLVPGNGAVAQHGKKPGRSLEEFRSQHDRSFIVPSKIKEALKQLGDGWETEVNFARLAGVSISELGNYREEFASYVVIIRRDGGKKVWAGTPTAAEKMRAMLD